MSISTENITRNFDYPSGTTIQSTGGIITAVATRESDTIKLSTTVTWNNSNDWKTVPPKTTYAIFTDTADSNKKKFHYINPTTAAISAGLGNATVVLECRIDSGNLQIRHTAAANRSCLAIVGGTQT